MGSDKCRFDRPGYFLNPLFLRHLCCCNGMPIVCWHPLCPEKWINCWNYYYWYDVVLLLLLFVSVILKLFTHSIWFYHYLGNINPVRSLTFTVVVSLERQKISKKFVSAHRLTLKRFKIYLSRTVLEYSRGTCSWLRQIFSGNWILALRFSSNMSLSLLLRFSKSNCFHLMVSAWLIKERQCMICQNILSYPVTGQKTVSNDY